MDSERHPRLMFVVSRNAMNLYHYLSAAFVDEASVEIVLDRRLADRRRQCAAIEIERRRADRRGRPDLARELSLYGWGIVRASR